MNKASFVRLFLRLSGFAAFIGMIWFFELAPATPVIEEDSSETASYLVRFPEDEQMMKELSAQFMLKNDRLQDIAPAAGQ